jgi:hypothetical protein
VAEPSADDKAVAILGEGARGLFGRVVVGRKGREKREPNQGFSAYRAVGGDAECAVGATLPDSLDPELDGGGAGGAGGRKGDGQSAGAEPVSQTLRDRAEQDGFVIGGIRLIAQDRKELLVGISGHLLRLDPVSKVEAVVPLGFDRWRGQKQRTTEVARNACLCERFDGGLPRECKGPLDRVGGGDVDEVNGAANAGGQAFRRKPGDRVDAGFSRGQRCPVVFDTLAKGRDDPHACDGDQRTAKMVLVGCFAHDILVSRAMPSPRK